MFFYNKTDYFSSSRFWQMLLTFHEGDGIYQVSHTVVTVCSRTPRDPQQVRTFV